MPTRHLIVANEAVGRTGFTPAVACLRDARRRLRRKSFHQCSRSLVEASIAKVESRKLLIRPPLRCLGQCVTQSQRVNAISREFTSPICNSLNVNDLFGQAGRGCGLMYNDMALALPSKFRLGKEFATQHQVFAAIVEC
jgi:hypothetical protein